MTKTAKLPTSNARTAYGLLSDICKIVSEEPKRLDMGMPLANTADEIRTYYRTSAPACGTVGCVAGWCVTLRPNLSSQESIMDNAAKILGLSSSVASELFFNFPFADRGETAASCRKHAREEIALIRAFQKTHAEQLKAKAV